MHHEPNPEILHSYWGCHIILRSKSRLRQSRLLSQLSVVGSLDPQIALLLRHCVSFCDLVLVKKSYLPEYDHQFDHCASGQPCLSLDILRHASSWLVVIPSRGLNQPGEFQVAFILGACWSILSRSPGNLLPLAHQAVTCAGPQYLDGFFLQFSHRSYLGGQLELGSGLRSHRRHSHPADILMLNWMIG